MSQCKLSILSPSRICPISCAGINQVHKDVIEVLRQDEAPQTRQSELSDMVQILRLEVEACKEESLRSQHAEDVLTKRLDTSKDDLNRAMSTISMLQKQLDAVSQANILENRVGKGHAEEFIAKVPPLLDQSKSLQDALRAVTEVSHGMSSEIQNDTGWSVTQASDGAGGHNECGSNMSPRVNGGSSLRDSGRYTPRTSLSSLSEVCVIVYAVLF